MKKILVLLAVLLSSCVTNIYTKPPKNFEPLEYRSVAILYIQDTSNNAVLATGFAYDENHIITAGHFCISALKIQIFDSHKQSIMMRYYNHKMKVKDKGILVVKELSDTEDICVLEKENHGLLPLMLIDDYNKIKIGDAVSIVGSPSGTAMGKFYGNVMSTVYNGFGPNIIKNKLLVNAASTSGISGSPIIHSETGKVIGMVVMGHNAFDHLTFGVTGQQINNFVKDLR